MDHFTPVSALIGGSLIGLAAAILWIANGRIAGISGILGGLTSRGEGTGERIGFLVGLILAPLAYAAISGHLSVAHVTANPLLLIAAGLLVGFGTRLGGGCTSGHGVCGIARLSPRSMAATGVFMLVAGLVVFLTHHGL